MYLNAIDLLTPCYVENNQKAVLLTVPLSWRVGSVTGIWTVWRELRRANICLQVKIISIVSHRPRAVPNYCTPKCLCKLEASGKNLTTPGRTLGLTNACTA